MSYIISPLKKSTRSAQKFGDSISITLPKELVDLHDIKAQDELGFMINRIGFVLPPGYSLEKFLEDLQHASAVIKYELDKQKDKNSSVGEEISDVECK